MECPESEARDSHLDKIIKNRMMMISDKEERPTTVLLTPRPRDRGLDVMVEASRSLSEMVKVVTKSSHRATCRMCSTLTELATETTMRFAQSEVRELLLLQISAIHHSRKTSDSL